MARGGRRSSAGRKKGGKNRSTVEREIAAKALFAASGLGELALDKLHRYSEICEQEMLLQRRLKRPKQYAEWMDRAVYVAKELAQYQSAKIKTVISMPAIATQQPERPTAKVIDMAKDPSALEASYKRMLTVSK